MLTQRHMDVDYSSESDDEYSYYDPSKRRLVPYSILDDDNYSDLLDTRRNEGIRQAAVQELTCEVKELTTDGGVFKTVDIFWPPQAGNGPNEAAINCMFQTLSDKLHSLLPSPLSAGMVGYKVTSSRRYAS